VAVPLCGPCRNGQRGTANLTAATLAALETGRAYVNVHTAKNAAGEIRGQIRAVPLTVSGDDAVGGSMKKHLRWALALAVLVVVAAVTASAMAFAGREAGAQRPDKPAARGTAPIDEAIRAERRESSRHTGCSAQAHRAALGV
jgi:hypothetical protein